MLSQKKLCKIFTMLSFALVFMVSLLCGQMNAGATGEVADAVYLNGNIYTVDKDFSKAEAIAIKDGKFLYVGTNDDAKKYVQDGKTVVTDLQGKTVIPGLIESHMHVTDLGLGLLQIDAFWKPKEEILAAIAAAYPGAKERGEWIRGWGWNQEVWTPNVMPTKEDIDKVAPDVPVYIDRVCGHAAWANSKVLELAKITKDTPNPEGGTIERDANGNPTGILQENAKGLVESIIPSWTEDQQTRGLLEAQKQLFSYGLTMAVDQGVGKQTIDLLKKLYESKQLKIRLVEAIMAEDAEPFYAVGPQVGLYDNRLTIAGIKIIADGSLGSRSASMLEDYSDQPGTRGNQTVTPEQLYTYMLAARKAGFRIDTHAIGDAANRLVLDTYEKVITEIPEPKDHRYRIEHSQVISLQDIPRFAKLGVIPSMQSVHATSDKNMAEDRVGSERIKGAYAWRKLLNTGVILPNGSDAPVERVNPYEGLYAAVTRMDRDGKPEGGWYAEEKMTREEALKSFTMWGAYASFMEALKGSIETGKLADFAVIDRDYMTCPDTELKGIQVLTTILGGEVVYSK